MGRNDRRNRRNSGNRGNQGKRNWNNFNGNNENTRSSESVFTRGHFNPENAREAANRENAIREFKAREVICPKCGKPIEDMTSAIADKATGKPMHFDCVIETLKQGESMTANQSMTYIGNGRFAVVTFENPRDTRHFKIEKIIEWEDKSNPIEWRGEMADLYSQVK